MSAFKAKENVDGKRRKLQKGEKNDRVLESFEGFYVEKLLRENAENKSLSVLGKFEGSDEKAVVILEKTPFSSERAISYVIQNTTLKLTLQNGIFRTYDAYIPAEDNAAVATVIYPAPEPLIKKQTVHEQFVVAETADIYNSITLPLLQKRRGVRLEWVYNILEKKQESERIVFEDTDPETGFILLPDMKWDRKNINTLYLQAIVHKRGIKSLRDLNGTHLPLLRNILENGSESIKNTFNVPRNRLQIFIHYLPSYYHLHVHFVHVTFEAHGLEATKAHLLTAVIQNIELKDDYYQKQTLSYTVGEDNELFRKLKDNGHLYPLLITKQHVVAFNTFTSTQLCDPSPP